MVRRIYLIPNIITAFGLACGLFVIFKVNMVEPGTGIYQLLYSSMLLLLVAALADVFDGLVARIIRAESEFGLMFDSLADAVSFGVAPAVVFLKSLSLEPGTGLSFFSVIGALLFSLCGVLRLARFNVKARAAKASPEASTSHKKHFTGLPIPAAALAAVSINLFFASPLGEKALPMSQEAHAIVATCLMIILGYFMISRWKFPSVKALHFRVPSFPMVVLTAIFAIFVLYGILHFFSLVLAVTTWGYIVAAWTLSIIRLIAGRKSKTLEDFEPDQDDLEE